MLVKLQRLSQKEITSGWSLEIGREWCSRDMWHAFPGGLERSTRCLPRKRFPYALNQTRICAWIVHDEDSTSTILVRFKPKVELRATQAPPTNQSEPRINSFGEPISEERSGTGVGNDGGRSAQHLHDGTTFEMNCQQIASGYAMVAINALRWDRCCCTARSHLGCWTTRC